MNAIETLRRIAAPFIPEKLNANKSSIEYQRAFFLFLSFSIVFAASSVSIIVYLLIGEILMALYSVFICLMCGIPFGMLYWRKNVYASVLFLIVGLMTIITGAMCITGGIYSMLSANFFMPAALGLFFFDRRAMIRVLQVSVLIMIGFVLLELVGKTPPPVFLFTTNSVIFGSIEILMLFATTGTFYLSDAIRQEAYLELQEERDTVQVRIHEATQHLQDQQDNITRINHDLEERNTSLQEAITVAENAQKFQADFIRNISHEVRTPLSSVLGFSEILTDFVPADNKFARDSLSQISIAGQNLMDIFDNILTLTKFDSDKIPVTPSRIHLSDLLEEKHRAFLTTANLMGIDFRYEWESKSGEEWILADASLLRQVLRHLLNNAFKFTQKGTVILRGELLENSAVRFSVSDTGIGIAAEFQSKLYEAFHQFDGGKNREHGGLGLGLAITKRIVEAMNGKVWCESELGKGATFIVELPITS